MSTIQKRADELKPGDVLPIKDGSVVLVGVRHVSADCVELMGCMMTDDKMDVKTRSQREFINTRIAVESSDLTPAQQHAEEMVELLLDVQKRAVDPMALIPHRIAVLLDKIRPPEPPTLAETLESLDLLCKAEAANAAWYREYREKAHDILDRARRAGILQP